VDDDTGRLVWLAAASRNYARNLITDLNTVGPPPVRSRTDLTRARTTLHHSLDIIAAAINGPRDVTYTRSLSLFEQAEQHLELTPDNVDRGQLAIRDLKLIDGTMAQLADALGLRITDYDTVGIA
jgi:hypothetical protein